MLLSSSILCWSFAALSSSAISLNSFSSPNLYNVSSFALGRFHDGVGSISGGGATSRLLIDYPSQQQSDILDYLFLPSFGASLTILKCEIGGEVESTNGAESSHARNASDLSVARGYEWWLMRQARARNPRIKLFGLSWGFPGWLRAGTNATNPFSNFSETASYIVSWVGLARDVHNLSIDYIGIWNECYFGPYSFILTLRAALDAAGFSETGIIAADNYVERWGFADALVNNATLRAALRGVGVHYPGATSPPEAQALEGLALWASEEDSSGSLNGGACLARAINENYVNGLMTATISWHLVSAFYPTIPWFGDSLLNAGWPTSGAYATNFALWAAAHTAQFAQPGWIYLSNGGGSGYLTGGGTYVSLTDGTDLTIVVEKLSRASSQCSYAGSPPNITTPEVAQFQLQGSFSSLQLFYVWHSNFSGATNPEELFQAAGTLQPDANGILTLPLSVGDVFTITTLASGSHGNHSAPPPPAPFPLPYSDNFQSYAVESEAAYFSDLSGAFEIVQAPAGSSNLALQQATQSVPIPWQRPNYAPHTIVGDNWYNVAAHISILLTNASHVAALGLRTQSIDTMAGIWLAVNGTQWFIYSSLPLLAAGVNATATGTLSTPITPGTWHTLALSTFNSNATATVDSIIVASPPAPTGHGWVALATGAYGQDVMFYDFAVNESTSTAAI